MDVAEDHYRLWDRPGDAGSPVDRFREPLDEHVRDTQTDEP